MTMGIKCITVVQSDSAFRSTRLCSIRDYDSTIILTSTELYVLIEYICTIQLCYAMQYAYTRNII